MIMHEVLGGGGWISTGCPCTDIALRGVPLHECDFVAKVPNTGEILACHPQLGNYYYDGDSWYLLYKEGQAH
jgi:hypothetical protein